MSGASVSDIYNYLELDAKLATSGQPSVEELEALAGEGVEVVINLALHDDPRYSLPDEKASVTALGMTYVHIPVAFDAPGEGDLRAFFDAMDTHTRRKKLVHCAANKRVTSFVGLYRVMRQGMDRDAAFEPMRTLWDPNPVWAAFIEEMLAKSASLR
jgi:protein tyrosine phosphatase (PTP) superfamily phosphohydrolase (DUF442 family)